MSLSNNIRDILLRLEAKFEKLSPISNRLYQAGASEFSDVADVTGRISENMRELQISLHGIEDLEGRIQNGTADAMDKISYNKAKTIYNRAKQLETRGEQTYQRLKNFNPKRQAPSKEQKKSVVKKPVVQKARKPTFERITERSSKAIEIFNDDIPRTQKAMLDEIRDRLSRLELTGDKIKPTIANLKIVNAIKNRLKSMIINDTYKKQVRKFLDTFTEVTKLQNEYWKTLDSNFKPRSILKEIKNTAIQDTVKSLGEQGIAATIGEQVSAILRTNITTGGSYKQLTNQLSTLLTDRGGTPGLLTKYARQITTDSINQFNAQYTQLVSGDLGFEWYAYQGTDIATTRPFCDAMTDRRYFHVTEIPKLLQAEGLKYGSPPKQVPLNERTDLPEGMIPGTNAENFFIRRGGYNCRHAIRPVNAARVPTDIKARVEATAAYKRFKKPQA